MRLFVAGFLEMSVNEIFELIVNAKKRGKGVDDAEFELRLRILAVYDHSRVVDMLNDGDVTVRVEESMERGFQVPEARSKPITITKDLLEILERVPLTIKSSLS
jgi:hypothetical protein